MEPWIDLGHLCPLPSLDAVLRGEDTTDPKWINFDFEAHEAKVRVDLPRLQKYVMELMREEQERQQKEKQ